MLQLLRQALGRRLHLSCELSRAETTKTVEAMDAARATARLNALAPVKPLSVQQKMAELPGAKLSFINREAVLNRQERIGGYEFSLNARLHSRFAAERASVRRVYDDLLIRSLAMVGVDRVLGHRVAILDLAASHVMGGQFHALPPENTILMLDPTPAERAHPSAVIDALKSGHQHGYRVGLRLNRSYGLPEALCHCDWVQIETSDYDGIELATLVTQLRAIPRRASEPFSLIAANIATSDDFRHCFQLNIEFFQGPFVTSREKWDPPKSELDRSRVILILNKLRSGAEGPALAGLMQEDPVLTYKFLRFINSAGMGLQTTVESVAQGLQILGSGKFYRWLSLLLFDVKRPTYVERSLTEQALIRARFMELIAPEDLAADSLFLTGLFSLLDQIMGQPISVILSKFTLSAGISEALLQQDGPIASFLKLAQVCETGDTDAVAVQAEVCKLPVTDVNIALIDALGWANEVTDSIG